MRADVLISRLLRSLGRELHAVARPDLPHLLSGPDLLVAAPGRLAAIFVPKAVERSAPDRLRARLILTRLALPRHTRCLIVTQEEDEHAGLPLRDFNELFRPRDAPAIIRFVNDQAALGNTKETPDVLRIVARSRFSIIYIAARRIAGDRVLEQRASSRREVSSEAPRRADPTLFAREVYPVQKAFADNSEAFQGPDSRFMRWSAKAGMPALRTDIDHTVNRSFVLDTGVPYAMDLSADVLFADELPLGRFDPLQPLRGAAFGGCLLAPENEGVAVNEALERVDRRIRALRP